MECVWEREEVLVVKWLSSFELNTVIPVQIPDEAISISHCAHNLGKGMHPNIPPLAMGK